MQGPGQEEQLGKTQQLWKEEKEQRLEGGKRKGRSQQGKLLSQGSSGSTSDWLRFQPAPTP